MVTDQLEKTTGKVTDKVTETASKLPVGQSNEVVIALRKLAETVTSRATTSLIKRITSTSGRLSEYAGGGGGGLIEAVTGTSPGVKGKAMMGAVKGGLSGVAQKAKDAFGGGEDGGKGDQLKVTNIVEEIDIGAPIDLVYGQWTRFTDFPRFMKKVENVAQVSDEKLEWKAQVLWSHRSWEATILEQVPNERIVWRSEGAKGHVDGAVTFHELTPDLTRVVLVLAYHPQGFFERTGNIWRAQGRRVRLELKHFRRHVMTDVLLHPDDVEGWHGEIHEGQVAEGGEEDSDEGRPEPDEDEAEPEDEDELQAEEEPEEEPEDEPEQAEERPARRGRARATAGRERGSRR